MGGAPAARGCPIEGGRRLIRGSSRCAGLLDRERKEAALGELPLRGAARLREEGGCLGGAPAARGYLIEGWRRLLWGELPLRGAAL